ncbi:MAG: sigma factor [Christensenellales bacterium]|jgi:RNA polymerase sigma factor
MASAHRIIEEVYAAKDNSQRADDLIRAYVPFIRAEAARFMGRQCTERDDEYSIAMTAFYEAIMGYEKGRGTFLGYAALLIRSRLIDYSRREIRHRGHLSLYEKSGEEDDRTLMDTLADDEDAYEASATREATRREIEELSAVMAQFNVTFSDVADNCPKQERTLAACAAAVRYAKENPRLLDELLRTKKLPMAQLVLGSGVERKTLERHRQYIVAMLLIQTNGYEIIRGHLRHVLTRKEAASK